MIFDRFDIHILDFPFSDIDVSKRRPALVLCDADFIAKTGNALECMVTSAKHSSWPGDCEITDLESAGLPSPSMVRMRFWTIAQERLDGPIGRIAIQDQQTARAALTATLAL